MPASFLDAAGREWFIHLDEHAAECYRGLRGRDPQEIISDICALLDVLCERQRRDSGHEHGTAGLAAIEAVLFELLRDSRMTVAPRFEVT